MINLPLMAALVYLLGMGVLGQVMLVLGLLHFPLNAANINFVMGILLVAGGILWIKYHVKAGGSILRFPDTSAMGLAQRVIFYVALAYVIYYFSFIFWTAYMAPVYEIDAYTVHAFKAKVIFYDGNLEYLKHQIAPSYPLQMPLSMAWVAMLAGQWNDAWAKMVVPFNLLAFTVVFFQLLKYWTDKFWAMIGLALLISSLFLVRHAWLAYTDLTMAVYTVSALMLMVHGLKEGKLAVLAVAGCMAGIACFTKRVGLAYALIEFVLLGSFLYALYRGNIIFIRQAILSFCLPLVLFLIPFGIFKTQIDASAQPTAFWAIGVDDGQRFLSTVMAIGDNLFLSANWHLLWLLLVLVLLGNLPLKRVEMRFFSVAIGMFILSYILIAVFTVKFNDMGGSHSMDVLSRVILHFYPLCPLLISLGAYHVFKSGRAS